MERCPWPRATGIDRAFPAAPRFHRQATSPKHHTSSQLCLLPGSRFSLRVLKRTSLTKAALDRAALQSK